MHSSEKNRSVSVSGNCGAAKWVYSQNVRVIWAIIHQLGISNKTNVTKTLFAISRSYAPPADVVATPNVGLVVALNAIVIVLYRVNDWHYNHRLSKYSVLQFKNKQVSLSFVQLSVEDSTGFRLQ